MRLCSTDDNKKAQNQKNKREIGRRGVGSRKRDVIAPKEENNLPNRFKRANENISCKTKEMFATQ